VAIAGWLGMVIIAELGEPVLHLRPAVFLQRAGVVLANRDPHIRSPFSRRASAVQLANPAPGQQRGETMDRAAAVPPGGPNSDRARLRLAGRCDEPVQNMWACRQRAPGVFLRRLPPSRMSLPFKKRPRAPSLLLGFSLFHVPNIKLQLDKATINIRFIRHFYCTACG
jgi:hypothetical protein